ncbi:M23 family metallopeptidase [Patescibacteria group bacterium]|nr:M23 family metallopeptidase [Patescibacteria group bacterium]
MMFRLIPFLLIAACFGWMSSVEAATTTRDIFFPTDPALEVNDNFGEERAGHSHEGIDIMGPHMTPLYAAVNGVVSYLVIPEASWGYAIVLEDADGYTYHYLHVNNDNPDTDDGEGGVEHAYAPGIARGVSVTKGQLIGWMGDSGNAEAAGDHLHFEIREEDGTPINPYSSLIAAQSSFSYKPALALAESPDINTDKDLVSGVGTNCVSGSLIKSTTMSAVYYCGADGKRYVFPNDRVYFSWYADFKTVVTVPDSQLASVPLGGLVTYRPGVKMVKIESLPNVYVISKGGTLRWVKSPEIAASLYGSTWAKKVDDISDAFFGSYKMGEPISSK